MPSFLGPARDRDAERGSGGRGGGAVVAVLRRGFFAGARAARFVVSRVPLSDLYTTDARALVERAGGRVLTGAPVTGLALGADRVRGVVLRDGGVVDADATILAVPCAALLRLLPPALLGEAPFRALTGMGTSPIVSTHLWLDRPVTWGSAFLGLLRSRAQWLFDCGPTAGGGHRLASVTSGARFWDEVSDEAIAREVMDDARAVLPATLRGEAPFRDLAGMGTSPIVSTHLWLDRPVAWGDMLLFPQQKRAGLLAGRPAFFISKPNRQTLQVSAIWLQPPAAKGARGSSKPAGAV